MPQKRNVIFTSLRQLNKIDNQLLMFDVVGNSMWPLLHSDDKVLIKSSKQYFCGDLLLFDDGKQLIVHRLVKVERDNKYIAKGDNRRHVDATISAEQILGRVTAIIRNGKTIPIRPKRQYISQYFLRFSWLFTALYRRLFL